MHIDLWTLTLQTVNVLVLMWLLARFLFRPVTAIVTARRAAIDKLLADAAAERQRTAEAADALARERAGLADEGQHLIAEARAAAAMERANLLKQATDAAERLQAGAQQAAERDRRSMRAKLENEAMDLAVTIATRLLQRVPARILNHAFIEGIAATLATDSARDTLVAAEIELRSATPLDAVSQRDAVALLAHALGGSPQISFRTDADLLAGVELTAPGTLIRNSWRADLERITQSLHDSKDYVADNHAP